MSFGINGPNNNIPAIQKAQSMLNNGGGGNLGYFQRGKKKKDDEKDNRDVLEFSNKKDEDFEDMETSLDEIGERIKGFWQKLHLSDDEKENPEDI